MDTVEARSFLSKQWRQAGLKEGDLVLVHSNINRTLRRLLRAGAKPSADLVLESFSDAVGQSGTLLLPLFNFDFTKGVAFDIDQTPSQMGAMTEAARLHPKSVRTGHPIYSFAVIGAKAGEFSGIENFSGYADDGPFGMLRLMGGKIASLDLPDQNSMTFYHHVEEVLQVDYRYTKQFTAPYRGAEGKVEDRTFALYVRDIERGVATHVDPMGELLWSEGLYSGDRPKEASGLRVINATDIFEATSRVIREGRAEGLLYRIQK